MTLEADEYKDPFNDGAASLRKEISGKWVGDDSDDDTDIALAAISTSCQRPRQDWVNDNSSNDAVYSYLKEAFIAQVDKSISRKRPRQDWVNDYSSNDAVYSYLKETSIAQVDESISRKRPRQDWVYDYSYNNGVHSYMKGNDLIIEDGDGNRKILYNHDPYKHYP